MALDKEERFIATTTGERRLYVMSVASGKPFRVCKPETSDEVGKLAEHLGGSLISIDLDPFSGTYAVTSGTDRSIRIFDLTNSYCIEKASAHAETITSVRFVKTGMRGLRVISTSSDGTIFVWQVSDELVSKMCARAGFRTAEENEQSILKQQRTRRVSTASAVRPTASISQMVRQGERRTFSTLSPSEQKYDDVYKKISTHRRNKSEQKIPDGPLAPSKTFDRSPTRGSFLKRENRPTLQQNEQSERISSKPVRPFQMSTGRERKSSQLSPALPRPSSQPPSSNRSNPVLRRALSRDAFRRDETKEPVRNQAPYDNVIKRNDHPVNFNRRESYPTGGNPHNFTFHKNPLHETGKNQRKKIIFKLVFFNDILICIELENSQNNEIELNNIKEDDIKEEEEEEEDEEDEEEIIFKSEQERATKTFEVTHHPEEIDDGWTTPTSDGETDLSTLLEEDEASNEEDAIVGSITERKPPRITTSLSRTTSHRRSTHSDGGESAQPFTPDEQTKSFIEIQKKLGKIRKRQSITAKFLSSLGVTIPNENTRPSLDHVMTSFHEHASKTIEDKNAADQQTDAEGSDNSQKSASQNTTQISDQSVKHTLEDLDGALVLLDSVMESYIPIAASSDNQAAAALIEKKLNLLMEKISKTVEKPKDNSPEITQLLEKYSSSLLAMVATKMK
jgi:WD40 repeat protein